MKKEPEKSYQTEGCFSGKTDTQDACRLQTPSLGNKPSLCGPRSLVTMTRQLQAFVFAVQKLCRYETIRTSLLSLRPESQRRKRLHPHLPEALETRDTSWAWVERLRLCWRRRPLADLVVRTWTSLTLKKATMKGCLSYGPSLPTRPAARGLMLSP